MQAPPEDLPTYRILTGVDDATFCRNVIVAQAIIWPAIESSLARA